MTQDFATVVWRMKLLGFNAIRLPFSFQVSFLSMVHEGCSSIATCLLRLFLGICSGGCWP
jgi:hypothetical protein